MEPYTKIIPWFRKPQHQSSRTNSPQSSSRSAQNHSNGPRQLQETLRPQSNSPASLPTSRLDNGRLANIGSSILGTSAKVAVPADRFLPPSTPPVYGHTVSTKSTPLNGRPLPAISSITRQADATAASPITQSQPAPLAPAADSKPFVPPNSSLLPNLAPYPMRQRLTGPFITFSDDSSEEGEPEPKRLKTGEQTHTPIRNWDRYNQEREEQRKQSEKLRLEKQARVAQAKNVVDLTSSKPLSPGPVVIDLESFSDDELSKSPTPSHLLRSLQSIHPPSIPKPSITVDPKPASNTRANDEYPTPSSSNETVPSKEVETALAPREKAQKPAGTDSPSHEPMPSLQPKAQISDAELQRQQRIQAMKERNEKNRHAKDLTPEEDEPSISRQFQQGESLLARLERLQTSQPTKDAQNTNPPPIRPVGPRSLVSQNGQANLVRTVSRAAPATSTATSKSLSHERKLGKITPADIWLVEWRDDEVEWPVVMKSLADATGQKWSEGTWRKRYRVVKSALIEANVQKSLIHRVSAKEEEAIIELNTQIHGTWPLPDSKTTVPSPAKAQKPPTVNKRTTVNLKTLGEILPEDIKLYLWRSNGMLWSDIVLAWEQLTRKTAYQSRLQDQYELVKSAVNKVQASKDLLRRVVENDTAAREELNRAVHRQWPVDYVIRKVDLPPANYVRVTPRAQPSNLEASSIAQSRADAQSSLGNSQLAAPPVGPSLINEETGPVPQIVRPRHTTGGKTLDQDSLLYYMDIQAETYEELINVQDDDEREESPVAPEDQCHFVYHVERRELVFEDEEEGSNGIADIPWIECGNEYENLADANAKTYKHAFSSNTGGPAIVQSDGKWAMESEKDNHGKLYVKLSSAVGIVEVQVTRTMRCFNEGILPRSKANWAPKVIWHVKKRTTVKTPSADPLFEEPFKTFMEETVGDTYTTLEEANLRAVEHVVDLTFASESTNLNVRAAEKRDIINEQLRQLEDEGEDAAYRAEVEAETDGVEILVEVVMGRLAGPRNL